MLLRTGNVASSSRISGLLFVTWMTCFPAGRADNLALLSGTLRTYQKAACDEEMVTLKCPRGTSITIQVAQYGKSAPTNDICASELEQYNPVAVEIVGNSSCLWPNALQTVVEACQKKGQCKFHTSPKAFGGDPCPGVRKFVEVAYKCRPYEFRSKVGCENDVMHLSCNPHSRIAVYSASYGRTEYESIQCPQPQGVPEETCLVSYATETVMHICHGKRRCALSADKTTFGSPCRRNSRMYLKVVYTCVPRKVLKERYEEPAEDDEVPLKEGHSMESDDFYDTDPGEDHWYGRERAAIPPAPKVAADPPLSNVTWQPRVPGPSADDSWTVTKSPHAEITNTTQEGSIDSFYIYIIISVAASLLLCSGLFLTHCIIRKHYSKRDTKAPDISATTEIPNGFNDSISEVDTDIDMSTAGVPVAAVNAGLKPERITQFSDMSLGAKGSLYIGRQVPNTYPHHPTTNMYGVNEEFSSTVPVRAIEAGTLRRGVQIQMPPQMQTDVVVSPRSLNRYSNAQYYYG